MASYINKLPPVFQTDTEKKFFDATVDQLFSKKDSDLLYGYMGQRTPGRFDPINDFYVPEPTKNRTWWQLEPTAFSRNEDNTRSNVFFYEDLLNRINYYGGNTKNQARLFDSEYYSWAPPIDYDMFINYQSYFWVEQGTAPITIDGLTDAEIDSIVGLSSYTTAAHATPANLTLSTGMTLHFNGSAKYPNPLVVENVGNNVGIRLVPIYADYTTNTSYDYLPWDGTILSPSGRKLTNTQWDALPWDTQITEGDIDYITIERGSVNRNDWSRTNKWFHIDVIRESAKITKTPIPPNAIRAMRPIIQFVADLELFNYGKLFKAEIEYGFKYIKNSTSIPRTLASLQNKTVGEIYGLTDIKLVNGQKICFLLDTEIVNARPVNQYIYTITIDSLNIVNFIQPNIVSNDDIIFATDNAPYGVNKAESYYYTVDGWVKAQLKTYINQEPLFNLYDHTGVSLNDEVKYNGSSFSNGNKIFSYARSDSPYAIVDPVLKFPIVYTSLGQASDIMFHNNVYIDRYTYGENNIEISGYYYYAIYTDPVLYNNWNIYAPTTTHLPEPSKQRVIDRFVIGYGTLYQCKLSVKPVGYPSIPDLIVSVNGAEVTAQSISNPNGYTMVEYNDNIYVALENYLASLALFTTDVPAVVEIQTYTTNDLPPPEGGYFEIPQQLRANPTQQEVEEISSSDATQHFISIIQNQEGIHGEVYGVGNKYRDSFKNRSVGKFILQNTAPALKSMLISSETSLDIISAIRFSQLEYTKFKSKFLSTALRLINEEFSPSPNDNTTVGGWVDEIIKQINISKEFSNAFSYSYMIAFGAPLSKKTYIVPIEHEITLTQPYIDLKIPSNAVYVYYIEDGEESLLSIGVDYEIISTNNDITLKLASRFQDYQVTVCLFTRLQPSYIPATPTKLGLYNCYKPKVILDTSYTIPVHVIIGHDGSKTIAYGDYRDNLLLELETRIYNLIQYKFREEYSPPLLIEDVYSGYYRNTKYTREDYLHIVESYLNSWSAKNKANYRVNDWAIASKNLPVESLWKLYNYSNSVSALTGGQLGLPGNWKGIFQYYYDTIKPDTCPWEMLGFSNKPVWWDTQYGTNYSSTNTAMWEDLGLGIIRFGKRAIYDPISGNPLPQKRWARSNLLIPVDANGDIKPIPILFNIRMSGNPYAPFDGFDDQWKFGDSSPVEQAWMSTSEYRFTIQEILYLTKPAQFGELMFDTLGTELSPGYITIDSSEVQISYDWQYVQNDLYGDKNYHWKRPKNKSQYVHGETRDNIIQIRYGYQQWISDNILFTSAKTTGTSANITQLFGNKIRTLDVSLANKLAGFTNKSTVNVYIESVSTYASSTSLAIPSTDFDVILYKGQPIKTYAYSGVTIRTRGDGTFMVYGYDLLNSEFKVLKRLNNEVVEVTVGGTPADFRIYTPGETFSKGEITRYNGIFYSCVIPVINAKGFTSANWQKLKALPTIGGITVEYRPYSDNEYVTIPYGSILNSAQDVFDMLVGWGAYLETQGWKFDNVSSDTNIVNDWLYCAKQFLFWLNTNWAADSIIQLSPAANNIVLNVEFGYPDDIKTISNGVYSTLDKYGTAIPISNLQINRDGKYISVQPKTLADGGIYFLQVNTSETEHILMFNNYTSFGDVVYDPLLQVRQQRLRFNGFRTNNWYGKQEAPGYLLVDDKLIPNYDTVADSIRYHYDSDIVVDNQSIEEVAKHLIGFESKSYLDNLQISNNSQYLLYQGSIRQKGTIQTIDSLFRSTTAQTNEIIDVYEEWALKTGNFGNNIEQVSTEFILNDEISTGDVIVSRMNFKPSNIGTVISIKIFNAETKYVTPPIIEIAPPTTGIQATAYAVLDKNGHITRVDMINNGSGYTGAPYVNIISNILDNPDKLYAVWEGDIYRDTEADNIIEIDIDDVKTWIVRPPDPFYTLQFPTTDIIDFGMPTAGYVSIDDVKYSVFDAIVASKNWGTTTLNPMEKDTIWVASTFTEDWCVYKLVKTENTKTDDRDNIRIYEDEAGTLHLLLQEIFGKFNPQAASISGAIYTTDYGNLICLQSTNETDGLSNYIVGVTPASDASPIDPWNLPGKYTDPDTGVVYNTYILTNITNEPLTTDLLPNYSDIDTFLSFRTMRFYTPPNLLNVPDYIMLNDFIWVDTQDEGNKKWTVQQRTDSGLVIYREQEPLIDSSLFENVQVYRRETNDEIILLPVYDPFKKILPAPAKQNLSYILYNDPVKYNVTDNPRQYSNSPIFGPDEVGKLWWDLSTVRYMYYEQPLHTGEDPTDNLKYRRDNWGGLFPGSIVNIYEWVASTVPPVNYTGTGTPKDVNSYVEIATANKFTNATITTYYFWVLNTKDKPNIKNRTFTALDVAQLLQSPSSKQFAFFAPIQQTSKNNTYLFYNIRNILAYQGNNIQVQYKLSKRDDQKHTQWKLFREKDSSSIITDQFWDKMVDSLCGYTDDVLPGNIGRSSISYNGTTILPVPDPTVSEEEKYGIGLRPQQSMFVNIQEARRILVQSANKLLISIPIRDDSNTIYNLLTDSRYSDYCEFVDWYLTGYENVVPNVVFSTIEELQAALLAGNIETGSIVEVINGILVSSIDGVNTYRFVLYSVTQTLTTEFQTLVKVGIEKSALKLTDAIYTEVNKYSLSLAIRVFLKLFRTEIFIDRNLIAQNTLYFAMLNYVFSEQKSLDWAFKSSYIYIKENGKPLLRTNEYTPDQINEIIEYIIDNKPYHTKIRDYTSVYNTADVATGYATDTLKKYITLKFSPEIGGPYESVGWDITPLDYNSWDTLPNNYSNTLNAAALSPVIPPKDFVSNEGATMGYVNITPADYDPGKKGFSKLYPYTFSLPVINSPTIITPANIVGVMYNNSTKTYGKDYYAERNGGGTYTIYFFEDISTVSTPVVAHILWDAGAIRQTNFGTQRTEIAHGTASTNFVINVDTSLMVKNVNGVIHPCAPWGNTVDGVDPIIASYIIAAGGVPTLTNEPGVIEPLIINNNRINISYKQNLSADHNTAYRNSDELSGVLTTTLLSPTEPTELLDFIELSASPEVVYILTGDVALGSAVWINGERIVYHGSETITPTSCRLTKLARGTNGTAPTNHEVLSKIWLELSNVLTLQSIPPGWDITSWENVQWAPGSIIERDVNNYIWNAVDSRPDLNSQYPAYSGKYTSIIKASEGGLWYANTEESVFLKEKPGSAI